jgi:uncharacterized protein YeaO (DUF488 family)
MYSPFSNNSWEREEYFTRQFEQELRNSNIEKKEKLNGTIQPTNWTLESEANQEEACENSPLDGEIRS